MRAYPRYSPIHVNRTVDDVDYLSTLNQTKTKGQQMSKEWMDKTVSDMINKNHGPRIKDLGRQLQDLGATRIVNVLNSAGESFVSTMPRYISGVN